MITEKDVLAIGREIGLTFGLPSTPKRRILERERWHQLAVDYDKEAADEASVVETLLTAVKQKIKEANPNFLPPPIMQIFFLTLPDLLPPAVIDCQHIGPLRIFEVYLFEWDKKVSRMDILFYTESLEQILMEEHSDFAASVPRPQHSPERPNSDTSPQSSEEL